MMWYLLSANTTFAFTHADTLRGSNGRGRAWWDVKKYDLKVLFDTGAKSISGVNTIEFSVIAKMTDSMQIDLQEPMQIDSAYFQEEYYEKTINNTEPTLSVFQLVAKKIDVKKDGNVWWLINDFNRRNTTKFDSLTARRLIIYYHGSPRKAINPPWDGGFSWKTDSTGKPWIAVSCQGLGASVWWPCKDAQWDEPDHGMDVTLDIPEGLSAISNGRLFNDEHTTVWHWLVENPINNYDVTFYIGDYVHWHDTLAGENGTLDLDYWVLRYNEERARKQFAVVKQMIHCFEYWMGPYPFYEDGYKLVEAPYLGMEHQSAVAYGNKYKMGYMGFDRTATGVGMNFDYIIVHESGHEWFGNNITAKDIADNWVHEGITTYSETLFAECLLGKEKSQQYCRGEWRNVENDKPIIGQYGVNEEGSNDMYDKGSAMMYMIRVMTNDDEKFRQMLRGLGKEFYHQTVTTKQIEDYIALHTGLDLTAFFDQYLRNKETPKLEYKFKKKKLYYRFTNTIPGFTLPLTFTGGQTTKSISPTSEWQHTKWKDDHYLNFTKDFLYKVKSGH